jgi:MSHA pilin protein MshB
MAKLNRDNQKGFTIVELVVVIIILGILAATALPRFINLETDAYAAVADGVRGALVSGVSMTKARWKAAGSNTADSGIDLSGNGTKDTGLNNSGWIEGTASGDTVTHDCDHILSILVEGGSTAISVNAATTFSTSVAASITADDDEVVGQWFGVGDNGTVGSITTCTMAYAPVGFSSGNPLVSFTYTFATGAVSAVSQGAF